MAIELHESRCGSTTETSLVVARQQLILVEEEVRGLLSLGKADSKSWKTLDLSAMISTVRNLVSPACQHKGIDLTVDSPVNVLNVEGSADGIRAAILNLTLNAIDAAGTAGHVWLTLMTDDQSHRIVVEDDGAGPPPELQGSLYDSFVTSKQEGIGLGLTIAATVAREHHGTLTWGRADGRTRFEFRLPFARTSPRDTHEPSHNY